MKWPASAAGWANAHLNVLLINKDRGKDTTLNSS